MRRWISCMGEPTMPTAPWEEQSNAEQQRKTSRTYITFIGGNCSWDCTDAECNDANSKRQGAPTLYHQGWIKEEAFKSTDERSQRRRICFKSRQTSVFAWSKAAPAISEQSAILSECGESDTPVAAVILETDGGTEGILWAPTQSSVGRGASEEHWEGRPQLEDEETLCANIGWDHRWAG